ncbi:MAG: hypothetical protein C0392_05985 [Syntrophus sp. (in: bacteria)]|nr:hypothetical protein [Syntrophus sp. (in: bacteria)]
MNFNKTNFLQKVLDAIPSVILIVDSDVRIFHINSTASNVLNLNIEKIREKRGGEIFQCIHSFDVPEGCGRSQFCGECTVRSSVNMAFNGNKVYREKTCMELIKDDVIQEVHLLITSAPFEYEENQYVLLIFEDITELARLKSFLCVCASCKKIRDDKKNWIPMEEYFKNHNDIEFSHGICEGCAKKLYPKYFKK